MISQERGENMSGCEKCILALTIVVSMAVIVPASQAEESIDFTQYASCTFTPVSQDKEFGFSTFECTGITRSNHENKVFENMSVLDVGVNRREGEQGTSYSLAKYMDRDGDYVVMEFSEISREGTWKILYGTGKWKGIKGSGKHVHVGGAKGIKPNTGAGYVRNTGTFELPK
jgi:hypothetical protein